MNYHLSLETSTICMEKEVQIDANPILKYKICYPQFSTSERNKNIDIINRYYLNKALEYESYTRNTLLPWAIQDYYNSIQNNYPVHTYEANREFNITYNQNCLLSLYTDTYEYTGGAHGNTVRTSETWDLICGALLPLATFFDSKDYMNMIINSIVRQISENASEQINYFEDYPQKVKESFNPKNYYLSPGFVNIYFQQYEIAPYAVGIPVFQIPL